MEQRGKLSDHGVPLSHADLRHRHQHLQLHLLPAVQLYGDTAGTQWGHASATDRQKSTTERHLHRGNPTWADLHGGRGRAEAALAVGHPQLEQVGALDQVGQVERGLGVRLVQDVLQTQTDISTTFSKLSEMKKQ